MEPLQFDDPTGATMERRAKISAEIGADHSHAVPATHFVAMALLSALVWTLVPALVHLAPPLDVVEGYMWGREWPLLTYKHPALPAWVIEASRVVTFGTIGWPVYAASQLFVLATLGLVFVLARDLLGSRRAVIVALPLLLFEHLSWRSPEFNHTIAQLPFWVAVALFTWRAADRGSWTSWLLLALAMAGGMYAKFSHGLVVLLSAGWLLCDTRARRQLTTPKPWLAAILAVALLSPIAIWFARNGLLPLEYARSRSAEPSASPLSFLARSALTALPMLLLLAITYVTTPRAEQSARETGQPLALPFALTMTLGPLLLSMIVATVTGTGLRTTWAAPMLTLLPLAVAAALPRLQPPRQTRPAMLAFAGLIIAIGIGYGARLMVGRNGGDGPTRANWPERAISKAAADAWKAATNRPLRIVAGDTWPAGLAGIRNIDRPSILTAGDITLSPWITLERLTREGALILFEPQRPLPEKLKGLIGARQPKPLEFYAPGRSSAARLDYVIIPPNE